MGATINLGPKLSFVARGSPWARLSGSVIFGIIYAFSNFGKLMMFWVNLWMIQVIRSFQDLAIVGLKLLNLMILTLRVAMMCLRKVLMLAYWNILVNRQSNLTLVFRFIRRFSGYL